MNIDLEKEQQMLKEDRQRAMDRYQANRNMLSGGRIKQFDEATKNRYLIIRPDEKKAREAISLYERWCTGVGQPSLIVSPARRHKHVNAQIALDLHTVIPLGIHLPYPKLDFSDETIHLMMLLCQEYSHSEGHLELRSVSWKNGDEVARQILEFYDRMVQRMAGKFV